MLLVVLSHNAFAQFSKPKKETPTKITSDVIDVNRKAQTVDFIGNVVVTKDDSRMLSNKMTVLYNEKKQPKRHNKADTELVTNDNTVDSQGKKESEEAVSEIEKIIAKDNVRLFGEDIVATSKEGYYDPKKELFVLEKDVVANDGGSVGTGSLFIYELIAKKGYFVGEKQMQKEFKNQVKQQGKLQPEAAQPTVDHDGRVVIIIDEGSMNEGNAYRKSIKEQNKNNEQQDSQRH